MTGIPGALFELTPRDAVGTPLELVFDVQRGTTAGPMFQLSFQVPRDKVLIVASLSVWANTDSTFGVTEIYFRVFDPAVANVTIIGGARPGVRPAVASLLPSNLVVPPGWVVHSETNFGAGATFSTTEFAVTGLLIPRGNFSLGGLRIL